ncbi:helix-turn-helix transcriptional regulator [Solidesulfovibrio alcoholivorans]|uniref:helix-turn-helix transcriptional regulator n=1 Tax=Solidesulfovibrio alcoholivorans TaxID=81406 RepID=UPI000694FA92|nr:helix-turn-helix transcriptional regulator [Solidesulfovibrio alcoholivorans]
MPPEKTKGYRHLPAFLLLALGHGPGHGAALFARMHELLPLSGVDTGAVYRTLNALEAQGEISGSWDTSVPGPARKIYHLTDAGRERLAFWRQDIAYRVRLLTAFLDDSRTILEARKEAAPCPKP